MLIYWSMENAMGMARIGKGLMQTEFITIMDTLKHLAGLPPYTTLPCLIASQFLLKHW